MDSGKAFSRNFQVNDSTTPPSGGIDAAIDDSGLLYVVWESFLSPNKGPVYLARSSDGGQTFPLRNVVTDLPNDASVAAGFYPSMAFGAGTIGVAWEDRRFNEYTLRFSVSTDYGQTFSPSVRVDDDADLTDYTAPQTPSLVHKNDIFYVVWRDFGIRASDSLTVNNMFFSYSLDTGKSFVPNVDANAADLNRPFRLIPSLAVNEAGKAFVCWVDNRYDPVFSEIYQIFGTTGNYVQLLKGDLNLDEMLSAADVVMEVNATFSRQHYPAPFQNADGNCDGKLSGADIVLLLYAVFANNPFPCS